MESRLPPFYRFISTYQDYMNLRRDYGDGEPRSMVEMHILAIICAEPGITVGGVAHRWGCTKGAASQNVTKLEKKGLLVRTKLLNNAREVHVYPTEEGRKLAELHRAYDAKNEARYAELLLERCTMEELETFERVLEIYSDVVEKDVADYRAGHGWEAE